MIRHIPIALSVLTAACVANTGLEYAYVAECNISNLSRISLGMSETEVLRIMHAPYDRETFLVEGDEYTVLFYVTTMTALGQSRMVPTNLTPLTFRLHKLVGAGYDYYRWLKNESQEKKTQSKEESDIENKSLEKALQQSVKPQSPSLPPGASKPAPSPPAKQLAPLPAKKVEPKTPSQPQNTSPQGSTQQPGPPPKPANPKNQQTPPPPREDKNKPISMSKPSKPDPNSPSAEEKQNEEKPKTEQKQQKPEWKKKDEEKIQEEQEEDFNFW